MTTSSNIYRKIRALVAKAAVADHEPDKAVAALNAAVALIAEHGLDPSRIDWPAPPAGHAWSGEIGRSEIIATSAAPDMPEKKPRSRSKPVRVHREGQPTQPERMLEMLRRPDGVSLDELVAALDIQPHSARALISIHARRKLGLTVKASGGRYRIVADE